MRKIIHLLSFVTLCLFLLASVAFADDDKLPKTIPLPNGWRPEGIAAGKHSDFYVGSLADGAIYKGDLRTGQGAVFVPGQAGRVAVGLYFDKETGYLFVAGGPTGTARVINTKNGSEVASAQLVSGAGNFINDVIVTRNAAYFTNSSKAEYYKLPLSKDGKQVETGQVQTIPLSGDWQQVAGFNANGIEASRNGKQLIIVNSTTGFLYRVEADSGVAKQINLGGEVVTNGDGIRLVGSTLYVVRNQLNQIAVIKLNKDLAAGKLIKTITDPAFRVPTTITRSDDALYVVNARFDTTPTSTTDYDVVRVGKAEHDEDGHD
ncbi:MAG: hypothetical protein U0175_33655 [Caldilineaceae bacterium]